VLTKLLREGAATGTAEVKAEFNAQRKVAMNGRFELIVQREASGLSTNAEGVVFKDYPIPPAL
jgi:hypothetical protein